jgi:general secretion pathway protein H
MAGDARARERGFTLIEIVVVIFIIGIIATFAVISIGGRSLDDQLQQESKRAEAVIGLAADEAQLKGLQIGLRYTVSGYEFVVLDEQKGLWVPYAATGPLRPRGWPAGLAADLRVEGHLITPARDRPAAGAVSSSANSSSDTSDDAKKAAKPQVLLLSSGEMTPFSLDLRMPKTAAFYRLQGDGLGRLKLDRINTQS